MHLFSTRMQLCDIYDRFSVIPRNPKLFTRTALCLLSTTSWLVSWCWAEGCTLCSILQDRWFLLDTNSHCCLPSGRCRWCHPQTSHQSSFQSCIYSVNRKGLSTRPWGLPCLTLEQKRPNLWGVCEEEYSPPLFKLLIVYMLWSYELHL